MDSNEQKLTEMYRNRLKRQKRTETEKNRHKRTEMERKFG